MMRDEWLNDIEREAQIGAPRVYCRTCLYLTRNMGQADSALRFLCVHPSASRLVDTWQGPSREYTPPDVRNQHNDCTDYAPSTLAGENRLQWQQDPGVLLAALVALLCVVGLLVCLGTP